MEWENTPESSNIEDRRGQDVSAGPGLPIGGGTGGLGIGVIILVFVISYFTGINPSILLGGAQILAGNNGSVTMNAPAPARVCRPPSGHKPLPGPGQQQGPFKPSAKGDALRLHPGEQRNSDGRQGKLRTSADSSPSNMLMNNNKKFNIK